MSAASCQSCNYIIKHSEHQAFRYSAADRTLILKGLCFLFYVERGFVSLYFLKFSASFDDLSSPR